MCYNYLSNGSSRRRPVVKPTIRRNSGLTLNDKTCVYSTGLFYPIAKGEINMSNVLESAPSSGVTVQLIIIAVLILINAFLASSELAILSANPTKLSVLAEKGNKKAKLVLMLQENETKFLSTIQVGITLAGFFSSATAAVSLSEGFSKTLTNIGIPFASKIGLILVTLILSYFTLVFGELFPKRIALRAPEAIAMAFAKPINIIRIIFKPIVFFLSGSTELLVKFFRLKNKEEEKVTSDEIMALVNMGVTDGTIDEDEKELIDNVFTFDDLKVKNIMIPRRDVVAIDINDSLEQIFNIILNEQYTRIPVYQESLDFIIGVLNIKDIVLSLDLKEITVDSLKSILREPYYVSEVMKADKLFKNLQNGNEQCAIVLDEDGSFAGFVTMEDLIEEIFGNIYDEHDEIVSNIMQIDENRYIVLGLTSIQELNRELDLEIENDSYNSLAGLITYYLQKIPQNNDELLLQNFGISIKVLEVSNNRIVKVELLVLNSYENNN